MNLKNAWYKLTHWEAWHYHVKYIPLFPVWLTYCIKARSFWFFTAANPALTFGGMEGETKEEMYEQFPPGTFPQSLFFNANEPFNNVQQQIENSGLKFPLAVKPNEGMSGYMFRKINSWTELEKYHHHIGVRYVVQPLIDYPMEVALFYYRMPDATTGTISGFLSKECPEVFGDGIRTLNDLIDEHPGIRFKREEMKRKHHLMLNSVIGKGERYQLSDNSNRGQGGRLKGLSWEIDQQLVSVFDSISHYKGKLYYGRYDIKCHSVESLKQGKDFLILEYNGSGSGTQHVYGNNLSLSAAWSIILKHWKVLYCISKYNLNRGIGRWGFLKGWRFLRASKKNIARLKKLDEEFVL